MNEFLVSLPSLAAQMEVDEPTLLRLVRDGDIPAPLVVGGYVRFSAGELEVWRAVGCPKCDPPGHKRMHAIRRAMILEDDERLGAKLQRLSDSLDEADADTLARIDALL